MLTRNVCGDAQLVPPREEDDPEVAPVDEVVLGLTSADPPHELRLLAAG